MISGVCILAHERARDAVKRQLRDRGLKVGEFSRRRITLLADEYLAQHPKGAHFSAFRG